MRLVAEHKGLEVYAYGNEIDKKFKTGSPVPVPERLLKSKKTIIGDSLSYESVIESENTTIVGGNYDFRSLADFFPVNRSSRFSTSLKLNFQRRIAPQVATQVTTATDVPIISIVRNNFSTFTGFVNLAVAADTAIWDRLAAEDAGENIIDDAYLPAIQESLNVAANAIAVDGDQENNVWGLRNNPYIQTVVLDPLSSSNPVTQFRRVTMFLETATNTILDVTNSLNKTYTLFLPLDLVLSLATSYVTYADAQVSLLSMLAGISGVDANDPAIPKFKIFGLQQLNKYWFDNTSTVGYLFSSDKGDFGNISRWWKPFSFLELGGEQKGLNEQRYYGARVGSIEFTDVSKVVRIVIPAS
jgi:hypothetical protein